jgi:glycerophosphoryl diester phosphodiesterase
VNAKGSSSIRQWEKGDKFYDEAVRRTQQAMKKGELAGVLWHQGESDQNDAEYLAKLKELIANLRKDLGSPELPFVAGQVNKVELINKQVARLPAEVPLTAFASSEGLTCMDRWHFDAKSMKTLGERYADAILNLRKNSGGAGRVLQPAGSR